MAKHRTPPHLTQDDLAALLPRAGSVRKALLHLMECEECRGRLRTELEQRADGVDLPGAKVLRFERSRVERSRTDGSAHDAEGSRTPDPWGSTLDRWFAATAAACRREQEQAEARLSELLAEPEARWRLLARRGREFHTWSLAAGLLDESHARAYERPRQSERLARIALEVAEKLDPGGYGERLILDLQARCWARLGNALRLAGDLDGADRAFDRGQGCLDGCFDPFERAEFLALLALLRRSQRRFDEALTTLDEAGGLYREIGETGRLVRILAQKGLLWLDRAEPETALPFFRQAEPLLDAEVDPRTALAIRHNLALCHAELGHLPHARRLYQQNQALYRRFTDRWTVLRIRWLKGTLEAGAGRLEAASEILSEVRKGYVEADRAYDAALVSLELAVLYARQGRLSELKTIARETAEVFFSRRIHREAVVALAFFRQAAERETFTVEGLRQIATYLKKSRFEPERPFLPATT